MAAAETGFLLRVLAGAAGAAGGRGALALVDLGAWAARRLWLGGSFGRAAAIWAYVQEALAAADAMLRATCQAWSALALMLRMLV